MGTTNNMFSDLIPSQQSSGNMFSDLIPQQQKSGNGILDTIAAPMDAAAHGGAQLISNVMAPFSSPQTMDTLKETGLYDVKHPEIENPFVRGVMESPLGSYNQATYGAITSPLQPVMQGAEDLAKEHGVSQNSLDLVNMGSTILGTAGPPKPTAKTSIIPTLKNISEILADNSSGGPHVASPPLEPLTSSQLRDIASRSYDAADAQGGMLNSNTVNDVINNASKVLPQSQQGNAFAGESSATKALSDLEQFRDQPLPLRAIQDIDENLSERIESEVDPKTGRPTKQGTKLLQIQQTLRDAADNASQQHMANGNGFASWKEGQQAYAAAMRANDVERIMNRAQMTDNPVTAIKSGFRTLASNPARLRGFTADEVSAIQNAAKTGVITNILRTAGSRLGPVISGGVGTAMGGPIAGVAGFLGDYALGGAARAGAESLQAARANKVLSLISGRPEIASMTQGPKNPPAQLALPSPSTLAIPFLGAAEGSQSPSIMDTMKLNRSAQ